VKPLASGMPRREFLSANDTDSAFRERINLCKLFLATPRSPFRSWSPFFVRDELAFFVIHNFAAIYLPCLNYTSSACFLSVPGEMSSETKKAKAERLRKKKEIIYMYLL